MTVEQGPKPASDFKFVNQALNGGLVSILQELAAEGVGYTPGTKAKLAAMKEGKPTVTETPRKLAA